MKTHALLSAMGRDTVGVAGDLSTSLTKRKIDIEGSEEWAIRMLDGCLASRSIDFLLVEISPVFNTSYEGIMRTLAECGYVGFTIPRRAGMVRDPLRWTLQQDSIDDINVFLAGLLQTDVLFVREDLR